MGCDLIVDGLCVDGGGGSSTLVDSSIRVVSGSQTISESGRVLTETGEGVGTEDGGATLEEIVSPATATGGEVGILGEDGEDVLLEDGGRLLDETSESEDFVNNGSKAVTTAGTAVKLTDSSITCTYVIVTAKEGNTGNIWVGGSTVASGTGRPLLPLQSERIDNITNVNQVYINATVSGDGVTYLYVVEESASGTAGSPTPLVDDETACTYLYVKAKANNSDTIWVGGSNAAVGSGIPLASSDGPFLIEDVLDVSSIYIAGNIGDGVTFFYGTSEAEATSAVDRSVTDTDDNPVTDSDGNPITT